MMPVVLLALLYSLLCLLLDLLLVGRRSEAGLQSEVLLLRHQLRAPRAKPSVHGGSPVIACSWQRSAAGCRDERGRHP